VQRGREKLRFVSSSEQFVEEGGTEGRVCEKGGNEKTETAKRIIVFQQSQIAMFE
jgi:hypothetical protein